MNPSKRVAIITGASSGLGREFARQLDAQQVADELWLVARNEKALADVAGELDTPSRAVAADLTSEADIANIRTTLSAEDPRVTFLVNAAGFGKFGDWQTISDAAVDSMIDLNCRGAGGYDPRGTPLYGTGQPHHPGSLGRGFHTVAPYECVRRHQVVRAALHARPALGAARNWHHRHGALPDLGEDRLREGGAHLGRRPRRGAPPRRANTAEVVRRALCANKALRRGLREPSVGRAAPYRQGRSLLHHHGRLGRAGAGCNFPSKGTPS